MKTKPELLLPAGSPEKLRYAIAYGADAVYLGLPMASLRTPNRGSQFTPQNLESHIRYAQQRGVKAYVTINIFAANADLKRVIPHLEQLEVIRPDAIIFTDPGVYRIARQYAPSIPLHLSTQANTLNVEACAFWQDLGVERIILAREVPYREIREIHEQLPNLELECFIHGSLCVAYSGRCVISDYLTDNTKNSNKGMCGNSCRWEFESPSAKSASSNTSSECCNNSHQAPQDMSHSQDNSDLQDDGALQQLAMVEGTRPDQVYTFEEDEKGSYMLNSKDLCLIRHLRDLQDAGIVSFKVEGRSKSVYYAATVGRVYRQAIDSFQETSDIPEEQMTAWIRELSQAGNRGFTEGFFDGRPNRDAYNYMDAQSHQTSVFLATAELKASEADRKPAEIKPKIEPQVLLDNDRLRFQVRNSFQAGDEIDWITPEGVVAMSVDNLRDMSGFPVREALTNHWVSLQVPDTFKKQADLQWSILRNAR